MTSRVRVAAVLSDDVRAKQRDVENHSVLTGLNRFDSSTVFGLRHFDLFDAIASNSETADQTRKGYGQGKRTPELVDVDSVSHTTSVSRRRERR